ncbi:Ribosomal L1 domain-containing protein 1 [Trichinella sp. T6]|nr:Ribosomal L1 domain-containing protein 1 [Trichinella sp. T6]
MKRNYEINVFHCVSLQSLFEKFYRFLTLKRRASTMETINYDQSTSTSVCGSIFSFDLFDCTDNRRNYEYDKWSRHFKEMLQEKGVTDVDYVISFSHLIREYNTYEQKKKLAKSYDKFLMDNRLNQTSVNKHLGKVFKDLKKLPIMVDITKSGINDQIKKSLSVCKIMCKIGLTSQCRDELVGNFRAIMEKWQISFPGALSNVRTMYLVVDHLPPLPVYASFASANLVQFPKRPRRIPPPVVGELSTVVSDVQVRSHADGRVEFVDKKGKLKTTKNNSSTRLWYEQLKKKKRSERVGRQFRKYRKTKQAFLEANQVGNLATTMMTLGND